VNYPSQMLVRKVRQNGSMKWKGLMVFVSESLVGEALGLKEVEDEVWEVYLCNYLLGRLKSGENYLSNPQKRKGCPRSRL
ncbi:IS481 family transposase, partial [Bacillus wiedmannii]